MATSGIGTPFRAAAGPGKAAVTAAKTVAGLLSVAVAVFVVGESLLEQEQ